MKKTFDIKTQQELKILKRQLKDSREALRLLQQRLEKARCELAAETIINRDLEKRAKTLLPRRQFNQFLNAL